MCNFVFARNSYYPSTENWPTGYETDQSGTLNKCCPSLKVLPVYSIYKYFFHFRTAYQYSFVGPLSLSKGCDLALPLRRTNLDSTQDISILPDYAYRGFLHMSTMIYSTHLPRREPCRRDGRHVLHGMDREGFIEFISVTRWAILDPTHQQSL